MRHSNGNFRSGRLLLLLPAMRLSVRNVTCLSSGGVALNNIFRYCDHQPKIVSSEIQNHFIVCLPSASEPQMRSASEGVDLCKQVSKNVSVALIYKKCQRHNACISVYRQMTDKSIYLRINRVTFLVDYRPKLQIT